MKIKRRISRSIDTKVLGGRIRQARLERGMTQTHLARAIISSSSLSAAEHERKPISLPALEAIARRLDVPLASLLRDAPGAAAAGRLIYERADAAMRAGRPRECLEQLDMALIRGSLRAPALYSRGVALMWVGQPELALPVLNETLLLARQTGHAVLVAKVLHNIGETLYDLHQYDEALTYYRQAFDDAVHVLGDRERQAKLAVDIGHVLVVKKEVDSALGYYERARGFVESIGDVHFLASTYSGLSYAYHVKGNAELAVHYSRLAVAGYATASDDRSAADACASLAHRLLDAGCHDEAERTAREAIARSEAAASPDILSAARAALAAVHLYRANLDEARTEAEIAVALAPDRETDGRLEAWTVLAEIAERRDDRAEADSLYQRALGGLRKLGLYARYSDVAVAYSHLLRCRGEIERATEYALLAAEVPGGETETVSGSHS